MNIPQICTGVKTLKPLSKGARVSSPAVCSHKDHRRRWTRVAVVDLARDRARAPFIHSNCPQNQYVALRNRVCGEVPTPTPQGLAKLEKTMDLMLPLVRKSTPLTPEAFALCYKGRRQVRYMLGARMYRVEGMKKADADVTMFVKDERIALNPAKPKPDPRAIQFRGAKYCVAVGRYLKPIEHQIYEFHGDGAVFPSTRVIGKGLSQGERAMLLKRKWDAFPGCVCLSLDASRFDQHCDESLLKLEHKFYLASCSHPEFAKLLSWQLRNRGRSREKMKYKVCGKRMSGDMNTALGNCVLMLLMVFTFCIELQIKFDVLDDGDDCLLLIGQENLDLVRDRIYQAFLEFGHEVKVENIACEIESVVWCQSSVINYCGDGWKFVRNPFKVMMNALGGTKWRTMPSWLRRALVNTIGVAELALNLGIPVLQEYALALMRNAGTETILGAEHADVLSVRMQRELRAMNKKTLTKRDAKQITPEARLSFMKSFDVSIHEQLCIEAYLRGWEFAITGDVFVGIDVDVEAWYRPSGVFGDDHYTVQG